MKNQINALTGLRGIAALWVVLLHGGTYVQLDVVAHTWLANFIGKGWLGVDLFFILSGFVISYVHQSDFIVIKSTQLITFLKLRLARIYPAHLVCTLVLIPVVYAASVFSIYEMPEHMSEQYSLWPLLHSLTLTHGWGIPNSSGWNVASWSVGSEWFAYLCFPFIAFGLNRIKSIGNFVLIIIVVFMGMFTLAALSNNFLQYNPLEQFTLFRVFSAFLVGCALFNIHEKMTVHKAFDVLAMITTLIIIAVCIPPLSSIYDGLVVICFAFLILFLSKAQGIYERLLSTPLMMFLGRVSYSVYLIHATVLMVVNQVMSRLMDNSEASLFYLISFYFVYISASLIAGTMVFKLVENPARHYLRKNWLSTPVTKSNSNASSSSIELNQ